MNRRGFLAGILAFASAPAIASAANLMPVRALASGILVRDDTAMIQALIDGGGVVRLPPGVYHIASPLVLRSNLHLDGAGVHIRSTGPYAFKLSPDSRDVHVENFSFQFGPESQGCISGISLRASK